MSEAAAQRVTYARYVAMAEASETKLEYEAGVVRAMAGGTIEHGRLMVSVSTALSNALRGKPCVVLSSDVRVRVRAADRATYPDVTVVCGRIEHDADDELAVINPKVIVEVSSATTELSDRTDKFADYRRLPSLAEYVLVSQRSARIEVYRRDGKRWTLDEYGKAEHAKLESLGIEIDVDAVYFDPLASPPA
jgi:Uma2 family endonuclease